MEISNSLEYQEVRRDLSIALSQVGYNPELDKLLKNIDKMVSELSKVEVQARRTGKNRVVESTLIDINSSIKRLEHYILIGVLTR